MREARPKIVTRAAAAEQVASFQAQGNAVVFTNGSFDILHAGHVTYLEFARLQGDALMVGVNSDASVKRYKGDQRPLIGEEHRARLLASLECVDWVVVFDEDEPRELIEAVAPDVLVKGEDWAHYVSGREAVEARGGRVVLAPMVEGLSTSAVIARVLSAYREDETSKA